MRVWVIMVGGAGESTAVTVTPLWGPEHNANAVPTIKYINVSLDNTSAGEVHWKSCSCLVFGRWRQLQDWYDYSVSLCTLGEYMGVVTRHTGRVSGCCHLSHWKRESTFTGVVTRMCLRLSVSDYWVSGQVRSVPLVTLGWHLPLSRGPVTSHVPVTLCHGQFLISTECCCPNHCCCCYCHNDQIATKESPARWPARCKHNQIQSCFVLDSLILRYCTSDWELGIWDSVTISVQFNRLLLFRHFIVFAGCILWLGYCIAEYGVLI